MRGILDPAPAPGPIRLLVGTQLMLLVQTMLVFDAADGLPASLKAYLLACGVLGASALICAIRGESGEGEPWWKRPYDH
ncbi:hypothetical protein NYF14_07155 [Sphingobium sp. 10 DY56-G10]|uniref:hypothetical protein n=1 Tax=Sphingomonadales TaxID=204457 RepID=UPI0000D7B3C4|nr:hypothetical protein [Sphingomonas sp. SKA58]EAT10650.1 hypothetical protein SKA58_02685 [Sphingomonas sp. SKA58]|tara:strand:- start:2587 stop:2823 length:237 start_codon:yes stop_codon:yes gene_type:complete